MAGRGGLLGCLPHLGQEISRFEACGGGVDGGGRDGGVAERGCDRGQRDGGDAVGMAEALGAGLWAGDAGVGHDCGDAPVGGGAGKRPEWLRGAPGAQRSERMDEFEGAEELRWDRDLAPVFRATLEGPDANGAGVEVDVLGAQGEDLGDAGAGVSQGQREGLVGGLPGACGGLEEAGAFVRGEVFSAAGVDQEDGFSVRHLR